MKGNFKRKTIRHFSKRYILNRRNLTIEHKLLRCHIYHDYVHNTCIVGYKY